MVVQLGDPSKYFAAPVQGDRRKLFVYVHVPFCGSKCHFCDWVQEIPKSDLLLKPEAPRRQSYLAALCQEIRHRGGELSAAGYRPHVVYFGGGTASSLADTEIAQVVSALDAAFNLGDVVESTIECSPETISAEKLRFFRKLGFNRFSMGVQSLVDDRLRRLGRLHTADTARRAVDWAVDAAFEDINIDLMCGFPDETYSEVAETISAGLKLPVTHLTIYAFRPTPGTVLRRGIDRNGSGDHLRRQLTAFALARKMVAAGGFGEYATGYFGKPAVNITAPFRLQLDTVGFGSGAVSYLGGTYFGHIKGRLTSYIATPLGWDFAIPIGSTPVALALLRSGLSVFEGIDRSAWQSFTGTVLDDTLTRVELSQLVTYLRGPGRMIEDERGVRLPQERAAQALLKLNFEMMMASAPGRDRIDSP